MQIPKKIQPSTILPGASSPIGVLCGNCGAVVSTSTTIGRGCVIGAQSAIGNSATKCDCRLGHYITVEPATVVEAEEIMMSEKDPETGSLPTHSFKKVAWCNRKKFSLERYYKFLQPSLETGHLTNDGPLQRVLKEKVANLVRSSRTVNLTSNGTSALHALVAGHELRRGRHLKWVTQAFTFPSSIQGPLADALVCDIDAKYRGPCMKFLQHHAEEYDGVIVTNVFGLQAEILVYEQFCIASNKLLIFDNAATPLGFTDDGRSIHDIGDGSFISFHETKPYGRGEGGAVFASREMSPFVHKAMNFGFDIPNQIRIPNRYSSNWRMSDFAAAAICDHLDTVVNDKWEEKLNAFASFIVQELDKRGYSMAFPVRFPTILSGVFVDLKQQHGSAVSRLFNANGFEAKQYYCPLVDRTKAPEAWKLFDRTVLLPFHEGISSEAMLNMLDHLPKMKK
ncbi:unnamed protein product [Cylindrotheca closterium]|uniref:Uncharacterized protein n=1 Tax=Cylindrotheca closterium TaxID=2856 RepID=A0AAD2FYM6_9STRA|nr:unnamed protein product [Cylindrotheca closterium]